MTDTTERASAVSDRFRLRSFLDELVARGEAEVIDTPVDLADVGAHLEERNDSAVWFTDCGGEGAHLVGNVMGSRRRLALALGVDEDELLATVLARVAQPIPPRQVASEDAPAHEVVRTGEDVDLTRLPIHLQHVDDGAPYISAALDVSMKPGGQAANIGCRRLMLRGRRETGVDLNAPSDLRAMYRQAVAEQRPVPVAFVVGSHPADYMAAMTKGGDDDEFALLGAVRGEAVPVVSAVTVDVLVPADAEYVLEGVIDPAGYVEHEGPYGEYLGYYGGVKTNPVFRVTAITSRADAVFQTATIGGRSLSRTDTAQLAAIATETTVWMALLGAVRAPVAVHAAPASGGMFHVRVALDVRYPGEARNAIAAAFGSAADIKHVVVVDPDIDVTSDEQIEWAVATRFQADRDLVVDSGFRAVPLDPSLRTFRGAKAGFDCTWGELAEAAPGVPEPPRLGPAGSADATSVTVALQDGPCRFVDLMSATGSRDGREIVRELEELVAAGHVVRDEHGRYRRA